MIMDLSNVFFNFLNFLVKLLPFLFLQLDVLVRACSKDTGSSRTRRISCAILTALGHVQSPSCCCCRRHPLPAEHGTV
jgi:hypothetical protein